MNNFKQSFLLAAILSVVSLQSLFAAEAYIPLKEMRLPADDLIFEGKVLKSEDALIFNRQGVIKDLSLLEPKENDIWSKTEDNQYVDESLRAINDNDEFRFEGVIGSQTGLMRFNVSSDSDYQIYTVHLDKTLHTLLLRVELLRKLGYKIPDIVHKKNLKLKFNSEDEKKTFLDRQVVENTLASSERWLVSQTADEVVLKDVAITRPSELDFYNVAFGVPLLPINARSLRALVIPYALLDLPESVNQFRWSAGRVDNHNVLLNHFFSYQFTTSLDDAQWMVRKLSKLSRNDFVQIVKKAKFPKELESLLVEKLIARRNSIIALFNLKLENLTYNSKVTEGDYLKNGKLLKQEFPDFASRFSYGDAESPLQELQYYLYAKLQSSALDNITTLINEKMRAFDLNKKREEYFVKQFQEGLEHFVKTGELKPIGIGTWTSPYLNANLIVSRDIVLGNYLGTDNLIQLADTFGASMSLGVHVGIEGIGADLASSLRAGASVVRTYSHIKPVKTLRASLKEPYKNIFVNLLKKSLREKFFSLSELKDLTDGEERSQRITELLKEITEQLDVGESLVITDRFMPTAQVQVSFNQGLVSAGLGADASFVAVRRLHVFKRSPTTVQIYDDKGSMVEVGFSFDIHNFITLLTVRAQQDKGQYRTHVYNVNLDSDLAENPKFFESSLGIYEVLKNNNFEVLASVQKPVTVKAKFTDRELKASLLLWKGKKQVGRADYEMTSPQGFTGKYYSINKTSQIGFNVELFARRLANYYISERTDKLVISEDEDQTASDTFLGKATTDTSRFEAEVDSSGNFQKQFISISTEKQGWSVSEKKIKKFMLAINKRFQEDLFNPAEIDFKKLRLYNLNFHLNIYERGIQALKTVTTEKISKIEQKYKVTRHCTEEQPNKSSAECGDLWSIKSKIKSCLKKTVNKDIAECQLELTERLFNDLDFIDFKDLLGKDNFYVYAGIDGFRAKSEVLNETIFSNSIGEITSKNVSGPLDRVRELLGLQGGEMFGSWIRN